MSYLLETKVLSELRRKQFDALVVPRVESRPASVLYLSVLLVGENLRGVKALTASRCSVALLDWFESRALGLVCDISGKPPATIG